MAWAKIDDQFFNHPKVIGAGGDAALLYLAGLCYCQGSLTDGFIPAGIVARLTDRESPSDLAARLLSAGLWERAKGGFQVHDFRDFNDPAAVVKAKREKGKKRLAEWRAKQDCNGVTDAIVTSTPRARSASHTASDTDTDTYEERKSIAASAAPLTLSPAGAAPPALPGFEPVTRDAAVKRIAAASNGRFVACRPSKGGMFKLDALRKLHPDGAIFDRIGAWLAAGGDGFKSQIDGRSLGNDLDAWVAYVETWDGGPVVSGTIRAVSQDLTRGVVPTRKRGEQG